MRARATFARRIRGCPRLIIPSRRMSRRITRSIPGVLLLGVHLSGGVSPETATPPGRPVLEAMRVEEGPKIDGRLDEPIWQRAPATLPLTQCLPKQGQPMTERTACRVLYSEDYLYIGIWCYDSNPSGIIARTMDRDGALYVDDYLIIVVDRLPSRGLYREQTHD